MVRQSFYCVMNSITKLAKSGSNIKMNDICLQDNSYLFDILIWMIIIDGIFMVIFILHAYCLLSIAYCLLPIETPFIFRFMLIFHVNRVEELNICIE